MLGLELTEAFSYMSEEIKQANVSILDEISI